MIVVVNYGIGNLDSVVRAFRKAEADVQISSEPDVLARAKGIVLPGVGSFGEAMENLRGHGLIPVLNEKVIEGRTPTLGICLGFQMFTGHSEEGDAEGLRWIDGETKRFDFRDLRKIPHMGWNDTTRRKASPLFDGVPEEASFYFAHSYYVACRDGRDVLATTEYGDPFVSAVQRDNLFGTQFHPEKSHANGLKVVANFVKYCAHA